MPKAKYTRRKDGLFYSSVRVGKTEDGKPIRKGAYATSSAELERKIADIIHDYQHDIIKESDMPLGDYADMWYKTYQEGRRTNTKAMYDNVVNKHIIPSIGHIPLNKLTQSDIQQMINSKLEMPNTCQKIKLTIKQVLNSAINDNLIVKNVANSVVLPKLQKPEKQPLTDREKEAVFKADLEEKDRMFIRVLYYFGLRREEAIALTRSDFDFKKRELHVQRTIVFDKNNPVIDDLMKSKSAKRILPIPDAVFADLRNFVLSSNTLYLFTKQDGNMLTQSAYTKMWKRIVKNISNAYYTQDEKKLNPEPLKLTAHIFRHNYCTILYYSGISRKKAVQLMGHSSYRMIEEIYAHLDEKKENAADKINEAFSSNF